MDDKAKAAKITKLRKQAEDKSLPQDVRNQLLDNANMLEIELGKKAGVKMAKGGDVAKKKPMYAKGGYVNCGASMKPTQKRGK
jgi:hypothetical protein